MRTKHLLLTLIGACILGISHGQSEEQLNRSTPENVWKQRLTETEYYVIRKKGTERPFTGELLNEKRKGTFHCKACSAPLFKSQTKFKSGTGWPSFYAAIPDQVEEAKDTSLSITRTEILCNQCGGHLGHVFPDGPQPTGLRYCVNSVSLQFVPE